MDEVGWVRVVLRGENILEPREKNVLEIHRTRAPLAKNQKGKIFVQNKILYVL